MNLHLDYYTYRIQFPFKGFDGKVYLAVIPFSLPILVDDYFDSTIEMIIDSIQSTVGCRISKPTPINKDQANALMKNFDYKGWLIIAQNAGTDDVSISTLDMRTNVNVSPITISVPLYVSKAYKLSEPPIPDMYINGPDYDLADYVVRRHLDILAQRFNTIVQHSKNYCKHPVKHVFSA